MDRAGPAGSRFHTHSPTHLWGEGLQNQPSRFGVPALPGLQAQAPQISLAGWQRTHTYLIIRVKLGLLLLSKGGWFTLGVPGGCPFSSQEPDRAKSEGLLGS